MCLPLLCLRHPSSVDARLEPDLCDSLQCSGTLWCGLKPCTYAVNGTAGKGCWYCRARLLLLQGRAVVAAGQGCRVLSLVLLLLLLLPPTTLPLLLQGTIAEQVDAQQAQKTLLEEEENAKNRAAAKKTKKQKQKAKQQQAVAAAPVDDVAAAAAGGDAGQCSALRCYKR